MRGQIRVGTQFMAWLEQKLCQHNTSAYQVARELRMAINTVYRHLYGEHAPNYTTVIAYCWYFNDRDEPDAIWDLVVSDWEYDD